MSEYLSSSEEQVKEYTPRYKLLYVAIACLGVLFFCRLWYLQIIEGNELRIFSERNRIKETKIPAPRGMIFDRNKQILVENLPGFEVTIQPQYVMDLGRTAEAVGTILNMPPQKIVAMVKRSRRQNGPFRPVKIKDNLTRDEVFWLKLLRLDYPGLDISETVVRSYPLAKDGAQLFGYVGEISKAQLPMFNAKYPKMKFQQGDIIGKSGLEEVYDAGLRGKDGVSVTQVDAKGREAELEAPSFLGSLGKTQDAKPGDALMLTVDRDIQEVAYKSFAETGRNGALLAIKPDGEVVAWVSSPSFDPNVFSTGISNDIWGQLINDPFKPLRDKVIQDHNSPGSTFKAIVALAALQEGVITPHTTFFCPGHLKFGRREYHCWLKQGHGDVNVVQAIEGSCDVFFYHMGMELGIDRIAKYAKALGLGSRTGIELRNEDPGLIPTTEWKKEAEGEDWQPGENLSNAIGQGFVLVTPLQMALAYSAIATDGFLYHPYIVQKILSPKGDVLHEYGPRLVRDLTENGKSEVRISRQNFEIVKEGLRLVANGEHGTARFWKIKGLEFAGKTGTVQVRSFSADQIHKSCMARPVMWRDQGWFIGYAPPDNPKIIVIAFAEHSCEGNLGGVPPVRDVIEAYIKKYNPELIKTGDTHIQTATLPKPQGSSD